MFRNVLACICLLCSALAHADTTVMPEPGSDRIAVARYMDVLVDASGQWTFKQVRDEFSGRFKPNDADELNFGFTSSVIWLRFTIDTAAVAGQSWYLVERYPILDHIALFAPQAGGGYQRTDMGDTLAFDQRQIDHRAFIFPLETTTQQGLRTFYLRISGKGALNISPMLYSAAGLVEYTYWNMLLYGGFYGCLLIMIIYNMLLALSLREALYAHFVVFLVGLLLFNLNVNGFGLQYLWPGMPKLDEYFWVGIYLSAPALAMYSRRFLALGQRFPRYDRLLRHYLAAVAVLFVVQLALPPPWSYEVSTVLVTVSLLLFSWLGWKVWSRGFRPARLYVLTWFVFWGLIFVYILGIVGWAPYTSLMATLPHIGVLWVVVMLSLALGDRIGFLERERNHLAAEARASLERHLREIERMNRDKSAFLEYVSHELNTPINWIGAADSLSGGDSQDPQVWDLVRKGQQRLMGTVGTSLRYFDLADRAVPPLIGRCRPASVVAALLADREESLRARRLTVQCRVADALMVSACESELQEVLFGALDNAIRFSHPGGVIHIEAVASEEEVQLRVCDQGRGASPDQVENLFKPFFMVGSRHNEEGYGLSLAMARVMIEQVGGRLWAESGGPDKGFSLVVCLPRVVS